MQTAQCSASVLWTLSCLVIGITLCQYPKMAMWVRALGVFFMFMYIHALKCPWTVFVIKQNTEIACCWGLRLFLDWCDDDPAKHKFTSQQSASWQLSTGFEAGYQVLLLLLCLLSSLPSRKKNMLSFSGMLVKYLHCNYHKTINLKCLIMRGRLFVSGGEQGVSNIKAMVYFIYLYFLWEYLKFQSGNILVL